MAAGGGQLYLVDAHALIFQVFHAIPEMSSPVGLPVNALFGFTRDMLYLRYQVRPEFLVCAFDRGEPTFRTQLYPDYKANRGPVPDDLVPQFPLIQQLLEAMHIPVLSLDHFEADDVLATVAQAGAARGLDVFICTNDKDCRQLIDDRIRLYNLRKHQVFDRDTLRQEWDIAPEQVIDFQTLVGDPVDNVPGVPGIGVKTAAKLLAEHGTLDRLLQAAGQFAEQNGKAKKVGSLTPRLAANLLATADKARVSRQLVRLETGVALPLDWDGWRLQEPDVPRLVALFQDWGFRGFANEVRQQTAGQAPPPAAEPGPDAVLLQGELFPFGANVESEAPAEEPARKDGWQAAYHLVDNPQAWKDFLRQLREQKRFALDLETTSLEPRRAEIVGLAFAWQPGEAFYVAVRAPQGEAHLDAATLLDELRPILEDAGIAKINQNIKYDWIVLRQHGIQLAGVVGDPMVGDYLLHAGRRSHNMEDLATRYLQHAVIPITDLIGKGKNQLRMDEVPTAKVAEYSGEDADVALRLCEHVEAELTSEGLKDLYDTLEVPLIEVLAELEYNGIRLGLPVLERLSTEMTAQLAGIEREIYALAGKEFNIASPKQLRQVLFDELKLPRQRKTGITGEASTDQETLERLALLHPLPRQIVEHRKIAKLKGTYVDTLPTLINPATGRVHASFNQTVAATGRLSGSDPNLQNIPVRTEQGRQIRQAFIPEPGWLLLTADYSQVELRLLAHFCGDETLRQAFAEDRDIHAAVAMQVFGVQERDITPEMRRLAKTINFGVIYGISAHGLATRLGIPREEGAKFIDAYFARYPRVLEYQTRLLEACRKNGYVGTILGRRRRFDVSGIRATSTYQQRNQTEREAINLEIQGSAADLMKKAMLQTYCRLRLGRFRARMLLTVHDELVFEVPPEELKEVAALVDREMTTALALAVPLKVDLAAGANWLDVEELGRQ
jgi:DNA polymerase-1